MIFETKKKIGKNKKEIEYHEKYWNNSIMVVSAC
jgi:hypothetical protein